MPDPADELHGLGHNNPPRKPTRAEQLYQHVLALERLQQVKDDASADYNERKMLVKEDGFDPNVVEAIRKRRKNGKGQSQAFDQILAEYEDMIADAETQVAEDDADRELVDDFVSRISDVRLDGDGVLQVHVHATAEEAAAHRQRAEETPEAAGEDSLVNAPTAPAPTEPPETTDSGI